jgi:hypothetical protein
MTRLWKILENEITTVKNWKQCWSLFFFIGYQIVIRPICPLVVSYDCLWVWHAPMEMCSRWIPTWRRLSSGTPISSSKKTDCRNITDKHVWSLEPYHSYHTIAHWKKSVDRIIVSGWLMVMVCVVFHLVNHLNDKKTFDTPPMRFFLVCNKSEWVIPPKWTLFRLCHVKNWLRNRNSYCSFFTLYSKSCDSIDRHEHPSSLRKQKGISQVPKHDEIGLRKLKTALTQLRCLLLF